MNDTYYLGALAMIAAMTPEECAAIRKELFSRAAHHANTGEASDDHPALIEIMDDILTPKGWAKYHADEEIALYPEHFRDIFKAGQSAAPSPVGGSACQWPSCQPEAVQQQVADQAYRELYSGESVGGSAPTETLYTCKGKGGEYALMGVVYGAGTCRGHTVNLYRETATGVMYYRTPADFADRMERVESAAIASRPAALAAMPDELTRLREIARLIGSIFVYGDFKAETHNERELEKLLREQGVFFDTVAEYEASLASGPQQGERNE